MQTPRKFRNRVFTIHTWLGLHLSVFFTFMFLTGALLVVGIELESIAQPNVWTTIDSEDRTASFGDIYKGIKDARPGATIWFVSKESAPWFVDRAFATTAWGESVSFWTNPVTGDLVEETRVVGFRNILRDLHDTFLTTKQPIFILISASSVILLTQIISGLITYRRFWKGFFRWPSRTGGHRNWIGGLHRLTALWALPLILLIAMTSFYFLLGALGFEGTTPHPAPASARETALPAGFGRDVIDKAEEHARAALPGFEPIGLGLPGRKSEGLSFIGHQPIFSWLRGPSTVTIDPVTFDVLGAFTPNDDGGLKRLKSLMHMLHFGTWGGALSLGLWVLFGFVATGVSLTGALIFATRIASASTDTNPVSAPRRIWRGLGLTRWVYVLILLTIIATAYQRYGPESYGKVAVHPVNQSGRVARLILTRPLRRDTPLDIELKIIEPGVAAALVQINGADFQPLDLELNGEKARARFTIQPSNTMNEISARLHNADGGEKTVTFRLGKPIW
ncbi:PepSY-associated TM helix domain-containing protein [Sulfitobacter sp. MF3-043]|uniref:PepSY-associated TM helix domain-containing protein n=1 Tax=Sulfitobacter sediminivivens TaxID=3252902 RepID=UPI0036DECB96